MTFNLPHYTCKRCGHTWVPRQSKPAKKCPRCQNGRWDIPAMPRGGPGTWARTGMRKEKPLSPEVKKKLAKIKTEEAKP